MTIFQIRLLQRWMIGLTARQCSPRKESSCQRSALTMMSLLGFVTLKLRLKNLNSFCKIPWHNEVSKYIKRVQVFIFKWKQNLYFQCVSLPGSHLGYQMGHKIIFQKCAHWKKSPTFNIIDNIIFSPSFLLNKMRWPTENRLI